MVCIFAPSTHTSMGRGSAGPVGLTGRAPVVVLGSRLSSSASALRNDAPMVRRPAFSGTFTS